MCFYIQEAYSLTKNLEINKLLEEPTKTYNNPSDVESLGLDNVERPKIISKVHDPAEEMKKAREKMKKLIADLDENVILPESKAYVEKIKEDQKKLEAKNDESNDSIQTNSKIVEKNLPEITNNDIKKVDENPKDNYIADTQNDHSQVNKNSTINNNSPSIMPVVENNKISVKKIVKTKKPAKSKKNTANIKIAEANKIKEQARKEQQKKDQEFQKKLDEARKFYLKDLVNQEDKTDEEILASENIAPVKKALAPFAQDELPAIPILNRSRSDDNYHIPYIYTPKEYIDILFSAISMGSISYFNEAFKYVLNPNISNEQGDTILTYAIFLRKYSIIASALAKGADPNLPNRLGYNPVHLAIEMNDYTTLDLLEKNNADMFYIDAFGRTYLMLASKNGFLPAVDLLVKKGVNINEMDNDGFTALSIAYRNKHELVVKYLLKNGAKTWTEKEYIPQKRNLIKELQNRWK